MFKKVNFYRLTVFATFFLFFFILWYQAWSYLDPDFGWHLRVGQEIWHNKAAPTAENYNFILAGKNWIDHEWLLNVITFLLYQKTTYWGVVVFYVLFLNLALWLLYYYLNRCLQIKHSFLPFLLLALLGVLASLPSWGVRMQIFSFLYLIIELILLAQFQNTRSLRYLVVLPVLFLLWVNTHGSFPLGIFILFFWLAINGLGILAAKSRWAKIFKIPPLLDWRSLRWYLGAVLASLLATLLNPYHWWLYKLLFVDYSNTIYLKYIQEWQSVLSIPISGRQVFYEAIVVTILILPFLHRWAARKSKNYDGPRLNWWHFWLSGLFLLLAWRSRRHFPLFFLVSLPLAVDFLAQLAPFSFANFFKTKQGRWLGGIIVLPLFLVGLLHLVKSVTPSNPFVYFCQTYPCGAVQFLNQNPSYQDKRLFNRYRWGGFLLWQRPQQKVFIDGRFPQYPYDGRTILEEYLDFYSASSTLQARQLEKHHIDLVLGKTKPDSIKLGWIEKYVLGLKEENFTDLANNLKDYLESNNQWQEIYRDEVAFIFLKKSQNNE
ncbi:hypothetical protein D6821_00735 [Candidatus Parcubacteria bacterium]|nr:MAG: hypothetical protein D6821_00735 [Candidatus Parcubacteria bacterium]